MSNLNSDDEFEYSGSLLKKYKFEKYFFLIFGLALLPTARHYYYLFKRHEAGEAITVDKMIYLIYSIGGVWGVPFFLISLSAFFFHLSYKRHKDILEVKNKRI